MRYIMACVMAVAVTVLPAGAQDVVTPRLADGQLEVPAMPGPTVVGWGEVFLQVSVGADGRVSGIRELRTAEPFGDLLRRAVEGWQFEPAWLGEEAIDSQTLVAAIYRPRVLYNTPAAGTPPTDVAPPSSGIPHPLITPPPAHPPRVLGDGVVVIEALVGASGQVTEAAVVSRPTGFDDSALQAAKEWRFEPARHDDTPVEAYAYLVFGFREPVVAH